MIRAALLLLGVAFVLVYLVSLGMAYYTFLRADGLRMHERVLTPAVVGTMVFAMVLLHPSGAARTVKEYA